MEPGLMKNPIMIESRKPGEPKADKLTHLFQSIRKMRQRVQVDRYEISKRLTALGLNKEIIDKLISHGIEPLWCIGFDHPIDISFVQLCQGCCMSFREVNEPLTTATPYSKGM